MNSRIKWKNSTLKCECRNKIAKQPKKWGINGNEKNRNLNRNFGEIFHQQNTRKERGNLRHWEKIEEADTSIKENYYKSKKHSDTKDPGNLEKDEKNKSTNNRSRGSWRKLG